MINEEIRKKTIRLRQEIQRRVLFPQVRLRGSELNRNGCVSGVAADFGLELVPEVMVFADHLIQTREAETEFLKGYPYRKSILRDEDLVSENSLLLRFALQKSVQKVVRSYLPYEPMLRCVEIWIDYAEHSLKQLETQFYHLDGDDAYNLKLFLYLTDVGMENGPFTFMPARFVNSVSLKKPQRINRTSRALDDEVEKFGRPVHFTGPRGTVVFADTCFGYHKGLLPKVGRRHLLTFQFTSAKPWYPPVLQLTQDQLSRVSKDHLRMLLLRSAVSKSDMK